MNQRALEDLCRSANAVRPEFHDWRPAGEARAVLSQMREIASSGYFFIPILKDRTPPTFSPEAMREAQDRMESYKTMLDCIASAREVTGEINLLILSIPDEELEKEIDLPFGGGMRVTIADVCVMHYWNMVYHHGQVNQIQLMLGDRDMH